MDGILERLVWPLSLNNWPPGTEGLRALQITHLALDDGSLASGPVEAFQEVWPPAYRYSETTASAPRYSRVFFLLGTLCTCHPYRTAMWA